jgi:hypothetical protein
MNLFNGSSRKTGVYKRGIPAGKAAGAKARRAAELNFRKRAIRKFHTQFVHVRLRASSPHARNPREPAALSRSAAASRRHPEANRRGNARAVGAAGWRRAQRAGASMPCIRKKVLVIGSKIQKTSNWHKAQVFRAILPSEKARSEQKAGHARIQSIRSTIVPRQGRVTSGCISFEKLEPFQWFRPQIGVQKGGIPAWKAAGARPEEVAEPCSENAQYDRSTRNSC